MVGSYQLNLYLIGNDGHFSSGYPMVNVTRSEWSMYTVHCILYIVQVKNGVVQETWARSDDSFKLLFHVKNCQNCQKLTKLSEFV